MKIGIVHISDTHIKAKDRFISKKINGVVSALNSLGKVDDYVVVFSGDLSDSGKIEEFNNAINKEGNLWDNW